jgi:arylsulfatase A
LKKRAHNPHAAKMSISLLSENSLSSCLCALAITCALRPVSSAASPPNIVYILCDDLGYGDVHALNSGGKIATPHLDRLAAEGMIFTDTHGSSSVCTPTRYGILTGRYNWRSRLQTGVLWGISPHLIDPQRLTAARLLHEHGYATACIGKWHLGMDWSRKTPGDFTDDQKEDPWTADFTRKIQNGPTSVGFDYYFGISASLDMPPFAFIENDHVTALPTVDKTWLRKGPAAADFEAIDVLPTLTKKAIGFLEARAEEAKAGHPFFLYLPLNAPHTPIVPTPEWQGKSGLSAYGDFVMETDDCVGRILAAIEKQELASNTLVIFTSDNGCSPSANIPEMESMGHYANYHFRGMKADIWDGGHRIPFIARWPGKVKAGSTSDQIVCLTDLLATCADLLGVELPDDAGEDSVSILPALLGAAAGPLREAVVHHSINGSFSIRQGNWKLELCSGSGGWSAPKPGTKAAKALPAVQLYDLSADIGEKQNVQDQHPEIVQRLTKLLGKYVADGRSTPGAPQKNDVSINLWKDQIDTDASNRKSAAIDRGD